MCANENAMTSRQQSKPFEIDSLQHFAPVALISYERISRNDHCLMDSLVGVQARQNIPIVCLCFFSADNQSRTSEWTLTVICICSFEWRSFEEATCWGEWVRAISRQFSGILFSFLLQIDSLDSQFHNFNFDENHLMKRSFISNRNYRVKVCRRKWIAWIEIQCFFFVFLFLSINANAKRVTRVTCLIDCVYLLTGGIAAVSTAKQATLNVGRVMHGQLARWVCAWLSFFSFFFCQLFVAVIQRCYCFLPR